MKKVDLVLKRATVAGRIAFYAPNDLGEQAVLRDMLALCKAKHNDFVRVTFQPPYKKRSLKENAGLHGWCQQIADYIGDDMESVLHACKMKAITRGYPCKLTEQGDLVINPITDLPIPLSSADTNTAECAILIDVIMQVAAELGIVLNCNDNEEVTNGLGK